MTSRALVLAALFAACQSPEAPGAAVTSGGAAIPMQLRDPPGRVDDAARGPQPAVDLKAFAGSGAAIPAQFTNPAFADGSVPIGPVDRPAVPAGPSVLPQQFAPAGAFAPPAPATDPAAATP